jgi:hypothetical protein
VNQIQHAEWEEVLLKVVDAIQGTKDPEWRVFV